MDLINQPIGFFDSGIGGISVLKTSIGKMPYERYVYFADTKNVPYGIKTKAQIKEHIFEAVEFLDSLDIKILVVACNTATSAAIDDLRAHFKFPIIGMKPAVKPAVEMNKSKRVLVLATTYTLREIKLENFVSDLEKTKIVDKLPLDKLVRFAEKFEFDTEEVVEYLNEQFDTVEIEDYETVVLGCTHFNFYRDLLKKILPEHIDIINGNDGTIRQLMRIMEANNLMKQDGKHSITFYSSGVADNKERVGKLLNLLDK